MGSIHGYTLVPGKKDVVASVAHATGLLHAALRARRGMGPRILAYHRVWDLEDEQRFPYDPELVSGSTREFEWQMRWLRRHMTPVPLAALVESLETKRPLPPRAVAVTFDDGHRDNYTHAFPILRDWGIPATIFLSTGYMDSPRTFWFDEVAYRLYATRLERVSIPALDLVLSLADVASRRVAARDVLVSMKRVSDGVRLEAIEQLAGATGIASVDDSRSAALTWSQVAEMRAGGITFGSHTVSHPILSRIEDAQLREELARSRQALTDRDLGDSNVLAYPVGGTETFDDRVVAQARACGYRMGLAYTSGVALWPPADPFRIPRLHVERYTTRSRFVAMLTVPETFAE